MKKAPTIVTAHNEMLLPRDLGSGLNPSGVICAANEARFTASHFSEPLTAFALDWKDDENLEAVLESLFPMVRIGRRFEFKKAINAEAFLSETDDVRAIGSSFKRVEYKGESENEKTYNKGLTIRIDHDDTLTDDWRERAVARLRSRLIRNELRRGIAILEANDTSTSVTWTAAGSGEPDNDFVTAIDAGAAAIGMDPNTIAIGKKAWRARQSTYRAKNTPYGGTAALMGVEALADILGVDRIVKFGSYYQSAAATKTAILGLVAFIYYAQPNASKDDPSSVKRFVTPTDAGPVKVYMQEYEKYTDISVEHYSNIVCTSSTGIRKLAVSLS